VPYHDIDRVTYSTGRLTRRAQGQDTGVGHILQPFQRRIGTAQMLSVTVPAIGCTGRKLEVGHWHPIQLEFRVNRLAVQVCFQKFKLEVTENGMLCCRQLELELQS
jgi:hypothetical protein